MKKVLLCLFALVLSGCSGVDKALYEMADGVSSVDRVTGQRTLNLAERQQQIKTSNQEIQARIKENYLDKGLKVNDDLDPDAYQRLWRIFDRIHKVSHLSDETWGIYLVPENSFNAYVTGGSYIVVHQGLLSAIEDDEEIAAVLGHELGHVAANHVYEHQAHALAALATGSRSIKRDSFSAAFTHEQEEEADMVGTLYAALAGYDPYAATRLWERQLKAHGDASGMLSNHPIRSERMARTRELADAFKQYYQAGEINPDHATILQNNEVFGHAPEDMSAPAPGKGGGLLAVLDVTLQSFAQHAEAKAEAQRQQSRVRRISLIQELISYVEAKPVDDKSVSIWLDYRGGLPLSDLVLLVEKEGKTALSEPLKMVGPRSRFQARFTFEDLNVLEADWNTVALAVDHAEWGY